MIPLVNPLTTQDVSAAVAVHIPPAGDEVTMYPVTGDPPLMDGATKLTVAAFGEATAVTDVGALGIVKGVTVDEALDGWPVPAAFVAVAVNV